MDPADPSKGVYAPHREHKTKMFFQEWASAWIEGAEDGWLVRIHELAAFCPVRTQEIRARCTLYEIAAAWKSKLALSEYAWSD